MALGTIAPFIKHQILDNNGVPAVGYKLFSYFSGTAIKTDTYSIADLTSANTNPVVLDGSGRATIFLDPAITYKFVLAPPNDTDPPVSPVWTVDTVQGVPLQASVVDVVGTGAANIDAGMLVYMGSGSSWSKLSAANGIRVKQYGIAMTDTAGSPGPITVRVAGIVPSTGLTAGTTYYADSTAGAITTTPPATDPVFRVGVANKTDELLIPFATPPQVPRVINVTNSAANSGTAETDLTNYLRTIPAGGWADGDSLWIKASGTLAANTNTKTLRLDVGGQKTTLLTNTTNVATNRWACDLLVMRMSSTTGRIIGTVTFNATTGAAPTTWHFTQSLTGLSWNSADTIIKLTGQSDTASDDITAETALWVEYKRS